MWRRFWGVVFSVCCVFWQYIRFSTTCVCVLEGVVFSVCSVLWLYIQFSATCVCFGVVAYCLWCGTRHGF